MERDDSEELGYRGDTGPLSYATHNRYSVGLIKTTLILMSLLIAVSQCSTTIRQGKLLARSPCPWIASFLEMADMRNAPIWGHPVAPLDAPS